MTKLVKLKERGLSSFKESISKQNTHYNYLPIRQLLLILPLLLLGINNATAQVCTTGNCTSESGTATGPGVLTFLAGNGGPCNGVAEGSFCVQVEINGVFSDVTDQVEGNGGMVTFNIPASGAISYTITACKIIGQGNPSICNPVFTPSCPTTCIGGAMTEVIPCNDLDPCTSNDMATVLECDNSVVCIPCAGVEITCDNAVEGQRVTIPCNDGDDCTTNDMATVLDCDNSVVCVPCAGIEITCDNAVEGQRVTIPCNDGNDCTTNDMATVLECDNSVVCVPCMGIGITCDNATDAQKVTIACNDGNDCTTNDMATVLECDNSVICIPCQGVGITCDNATNAQKVTIACNDGNDCTTNDMATVLECDNSVICIPCQGVGITCDNATDAQKVTIPCNDGNDCTTNDVATVLECDNSVVCVPCQGVGITCDNATDGQKVTRRCDDGNDCTINDVATVLECDNSVVCVPCMGVGITCDNATPTQKLTRPCDDGDACTINDMETVLECDNSVVCLPCAGTPIPEPVCDETCEVFNPATCDCERVIFPNYPCNDGNDCTVDDKYDENCNCSGRYIGIPNDPCDDGDDCTINDKFDWNCNCIGEPDNTDSDKDGIPDCEDPCPYDINDLVYADLKCGVPVYSNNARGKALFSNYGECTPPECLATGRELIYRLELKVQTDLTVTFREQIHGNQVKKLNLFILDNLCGPSYCLPNSVIHAPPRPGETNGITTVKDAAPGTYFFVVDGNHPQASARFALLVECTSGEAAVCPEDAYLSETFESYDAGGYITNLDESNWQIEGGTNRSAIISDNRAASGKQSLEFNRASGNIEDINFMLGKKYEGVYRISWDMYIEPMAAASFGLFGGDNSDPWGTIGHRFYMNSAKYQSRWFRVEMFVDLDKNKYAIFMDNRHFEERGDYYLNLFHLNFYNPPGGHFYIDNVCYANVKEIPESAKDRGLDEDFGQIQLFPNPVREEMTLEIPDLNGQSGQLQIFNAFGQQVYNEKTTFENDFKTINARNFENGIYWLVIKLDNRKLLTKRFVMEHWK